MADPRNTGRTQGQVGTVSCRWCKRRFRVWTLTSSGKKATWHIAVRRHVAQQHAYEALSAADPIRMVAREAGEGISR